MTDILKQICDDKQRHVAECKRRLPLTALKQQINNLPTTRGFMRALTTTVQNGAIGLIAEIKKASPSQGVIRSDFNPEALARAYKTGGATCLSVLTDIPYFQGNDAYLAEVKKVVELPILRKDFIVDTYQIWESRMLGADCILLIMAAISDDFAHEACALAASLQLDVLVEVHNQEELDRALTLPITTIGINNRNLKTMEVSLETSIMLRRNIPEDYLVICESGIHHHTDIRTMQQANIHSFLVGESLMRQADIATATAQLLGKQK